MLTSAGAVQVSSATCRQYGGKVAIKLVCGQGHTMAVSRQGLLKDLTVCAALGPHPRTMMPVDALFAADERHTLDHLIGLVYPLHEHGSLEDCANQVRKASPGAAVNVHTALQVMADVLCGLRHMHACGVAHCDIKDANVLVAGDRRCIVSDYGLSRAIGAECHVGCTFEYAAPEVCSLPALPFSATNSRSMKLMRSQ